MTVSRKLIIKKRYPRFPVIPRFNDGIIGGFKLTEQNWYKVLVEWITNLIDNKYLLQRFFSNFIDDDDTGVKNATPYSKRRTKPVRDGFQNPFLMVDGSGTIENRKMKQLQKELLRILSVYKNNIEGGASLDNAGDPEQQIIAPDEDVKENTEKKLQSRKSTRLELQSP